MARWRVVVALLVDAAGESLRLAGLLERWPATVRSNRVLDDTPRRIWRCRRKGTVA